MWNIPDAVDPLVWFILAAILIAGLYSLYRNKKRKASKGDWRELKLRSGIGGAEIALLRYRVADYPDGTWAFEHARTLSWIHGEAWPAIVPTWTHDLVVGDHISSVECYPHPIPLDGPEIEAAKLAVKATVVKVCCKEGDEADQLVKSTHADGVMLAGIGGCKILLRTFASHHDGGAFVHELVHVGQWYLARQGTLHETWRPIHWKIAKTYRSRG